MWNSENKQKLIDITRQARVVESKSDWLFINRLWYDPKTRSPFYELLLEFWMQELKDVDNCILLCPEGVISSFGSIPFASLLAEKLGLFLVVWEEYGDALTASPLMYPDKSILESGKRCVVLQEAVSKGSTLRKMYSDLNELSWKICRYVTLVQIDETKKDLEENINYCKNNWDFLTEDFIFIPVLHDKEIKGEK